MLSHYQKIRSPCLSLDYMIITPLDSSKGDFRVPGVLEIMVSSVCKSCARRCHGRAVCEACLCNSLARACKRDFFSDSARMNSFPGIPLAMFGSDSTQGRPSFNAIKEVTLQQGLSDGIVETGKKSASKKGAPVVQPVLSSSSPEKENKYLTGQNFQGEKRAFDRPVLKARDSARDEMRAVEVPKKLRGIIKNSNDEALLSFLAGNPGDPSQAEERPVKKKVHFNLEEAPESQSTTANPSIAAQSRMMLMSHRGLQIRSTRAPMSKEEKFVNHRRLLGTKLGTPTSDHGGFEADWDFGDETEALVSSFQRLMSASSTRSPFTTRRTKPNSSVVRRRIPLWQRRQLLKPRPLQLH